MGKGKGYNSCYVYCHAKGWSKKSEENFLNDFGKGFWNGMMEGEKIESHQKGFWKLKCFSPLKILTSALFEETLEAFLSLPLFSFLFSCSVSWGLGDFDDIWKENTGVGHIFQNGVMHTNIAKPWLWRWGSYGYIAGGCIFRSGVMHANNFFKWG
jgi:hypothetical protein